MAEYQVVLRDEVLTDIEDLLGFYLENSQDYALVLRLESVIFDACDSLAVMPMRHPTAVFSTRIRKFKIPKFPILVYFEIMPNYQVQVWHILHGASNHQDRLIHQFDEL